MKKDVNIRIFVGFVMDFKKLKFNEILMRMKREHVKQQT